MKANRLIAALGFLLSLACACEQEPMISITSPSDIELSADGSSGKIVFTVNREWIATPSEPWLTVSPSSGTASDGPVTVTVSAGANDTYGDRSATVTISAGDLSQTVPVHQSKNLGFIVPKKSFELASGSTSFEVEVQANVEYKVEIPCDWIRQTGTRGLKPDRLAFSVEENTSYDARSATLRIKPQAAGLAEAAVSVSQAQKDAILIDDTNFDMPYGGGVIEMAVSSNVDFEVKSSVDWIRYQGTKSLRNSVIRLSVDENKETEARQGTVTISQKNGSIKHTVTVRQDHVIAVTGVILDQTDISIPLGDKAVLTATVLPDDATDKSVQWSSDNTSVAYVDMDGVVLSKSVGTATITAKAGDAAATCKVTVEDRTIQLSDLIEVSEEGGTVEVDVKYNVDFEVVIGNEAREWLCFVQTRAMTYGKIQFQVAANDCDDVRIANVTIYDKSRMMHPIFIQLRQASRMRRLLTEFYYAMDGPNWSEQGEWCTDAHYRRWWGVYCDELDKGVTGLFLRNMGLKGEIPACIGEFSDLKTLYIDNEPGIVGGLPKEIAKLSNLEEIVIQQTSMTHLPDVFEGLNNLREVAIHGNGQMTGPMPESIGLCSDKLEELDLKYNSFTGSIPASWSKVAGILSVYNNCLTGKISNDFSSREGIKEFVKNGNLWQKNGYGFDISDLDIPGYEYWVDVPVENTDGTIFTFDDVISKSKYTVYVVWASWCTFSRTLMPALRNYYQTYRQDGLEVIATSQVGGVDEYGVGHMIDDRDGYFKEVAEKGYDGFYNFYWPDYGNSYHKTTPNAEVYDKDGNVLFSSFEEFPDPVRNRFGKTASSELIPFLETLFGPADPGAPYTSTDFSSDGEVLTLQKATVGKGINIVFMGDAYVDKDMGSGGVYETVMKQAMEQFFAIEPYKTYRNRFNVYAVKVVSKNNRVGTGYETALGTFFGKNTYVNGDNDKCYGYAMKVPGINSRENLLVSVLVNSDHNCGTAIFSAGSQSSVARVPSFGNDPDLFGPTLQHEAGGHGFAFLADEYSTNSGTPPQSYKDEHNEAYDKFGWFSNVDFTDDPAKVRWSAFLSDSRYNGQVGIYEGADLYSEGVWRPSLNSIMRENFGGFNAPSRWAIYQQIMKRSGESYSFESFLEYDAVNRNAAAGAPEAGELPQKAPSRRREPGAPPVIVW